MNKRDHPTQRMRRARAAASSSSASGALGAAGLTLPQLLAACGGDDDASAHVGQHRRRHAASGDAPPAAAVATRCSSRTGRRTSTRPRTASIGTVDRFMEATGVDMTYTEAFNDNVEYFAKIQPLLGTRRDDRSRHHRPDELARRPSDHPRLARQAAARPGPQQGEPARRPRRTRRGIRPASTRCRGRPGSPASPTTSTSTGRELTSVDDLWDPAFKGKVGALTEMRDTIGVHRC